MDEQKRKKETDWFFSNFSNSSSSMREQLESFDNYALSKLKGEERKRAIIFLIDRLEQGVNDPRVIYALEAMDCKDAVNSLKKAATHEDHTAVASAMALKRMTKFDAIASLLQTIQNGYDESATIMALNELENFKDEKSNKKVIQVLCKKLTDHVKGRIMPNLVHFTVQKILCERIGLKQYYDDDCGEFNLLLCRCNSEFSSLSIPANKLFLKLIKKIISGSSPDSIGLKLSKKSIFTESVEYKSFWKSCFSNDDQKKSKLDLDSFIKIKDKTEKSFADLFVTRLLSEGDLRSLEAFAFLSFPKKLSLAILREALKKYPAQTKQFLQIKNCMEQLRKQ